MTEAAFVKTQSDNLPKIDSFSAVSFINENPSFVSIDICGAKAAKAVMEERDTPFSHDYIPILYQDGPLDVTPYDSFNPPTTHAMILPRPNEIRTLRAVSEEKMIDRLPWMERQSQLQGRIDHRLWQVLKDRGTACNHGHLVMPDYIVPGYTGCRHRNPGSSAHIFKRCCPTAQPDYDIIQHKLPYEYQRVSEPCRQITPIVPGFRLTQWQY